MLGLVLWFSGGGKEKEEDCAVVLEGLFLWVIRMEEMLWVLVVIWV